MLGVLLTAALILAALVSFLPPEWQQGPIGMPGPNLIRAGVGARVPALTPAPTPAPGAGSGAGRPARTDNGFGRSGFDPLGSRLPDLGGFTVRLASILTVL